MNAPVIFAAVAGALLACVFAAGLLWLAKHRRKNSTTSKAVVWFCLVNGVAWVWCSYILAYLGREQIAQDLSRVALTEIVAVVLVYMLKSLFEKRPGFGAVGKIEKKEEDTYGAD